MIFVLETHEVPFVETHEEPFVYVEPYRLSSKKNHFTKKEI